MLQWVSDNALKANPDKFHLRLNSGDCEIFIDIDNHRKTMGIYICIYIYIDNHRKTMGIYHMYIYTLIIIGKLWVYICIYIH